jgi:hypothetical protein
MRNAKKSSFFASAAAFKRKRLAATLVAAGVSLGLAVNRQAYANFHVGDFLLSNSSDSLGLLNNLQQYSSTGTLLQTFYAPTGTTYCEGAALTADMKLVTTIRTPSPSIAIFAADGSLFSCFPTPQVIGGPGDVSIFADGTLAISDINGSAIRLYTQTGDFVRSITLPAGAKGWGNTCAPDNTLWVADYTGHIYHVNESGTLLNNFAVSGTHSDLVVDPTDNSLWVADSYDNSVLHISSAGSLLKKFSTNMWFADGIALANDHTLYVCGEFSSSLAHYSTDGTYLNSINLSGNYQPVFLNIVSSVPEPTSLFLLALGTLVVLRRRP